jgi:hypothetical protein
VGLRGHREARHGALTADAFRSVFASIGTSYTPVMTFSVDFANGRHDNASKYREFIWKTSCDCVGYLGPLKTVPRT